MKTAFLSLADTDEKVIVARNSHKSVIEAIILAAVNPVFAPPLWDAEWELSHPPTAASIAALLEAEPDAKAVFLVSPTDYGVAGELQQIAAVCHEHGTPLVVDEAWSAHFPWHPDLPVSGIEADADPAPWGGVISEHRRPRHAAGCGTSSTTAPPQQGGCGVATVSGPDRRGRRRSGTRG